MVLSVFEGMVVSLKERHGVLFSLQVSVFSDCIFFILWTIPLVFITLDTQYLHLRVDGLAESVTLNVSLLKTS